jgi:hypothetical protein
MKKSDPRQLDLFAPSPAKGEGRPPAAARFELSDEQLQRALDLLRRDVARLTVTGMRPDLTPEQTEAVGRMSARRAGQRRGAGGRSGSGAA